MKKTLFVSYSHESIDRPKLDYLLEQIQKKESSKVRILIDLQEVRIGGSFTDYMALIDNHNVDAVLMVLTPSYKRKVMNNEGNVPPEFKAVMARYIDDKQAYLQLPKSDLSLYENVRKFGVLPILFHGTPEESVPDTIIGQESLKYVDITGAVVHERDGKLVPVGSSQKVLDDLANQVLVEVKNIARQKDKDYQERRAKIRQALFANTKAGAYPKLETEVFARTMTYLRVLSQESYFIVGRKGSGKSTLTEQLELQDPNRYSVHVGIDFSKISLAFIYSFYTDPQFQSDASATRGYRAEYLELVWECFFLICLIWQHKDTDLFSAWLRDDFEDDVSQYEPQEFFNVALSHSIEHFFIFQNKRISDSRDTLSSLSARLSSRNFIESVFGKEIIDAIAVEVRACKTLITLDGIDSAFHDHRMEYMRFGKQEEDNYYQNRARVEIDLIKALIRLVDGVKVKSTNYPALSLCDFCITIPLDLYQEVKWHHERDSYQLLSSCRSLDWSGSELALMLRKRLEKLNSIQIDKEKHYNPKERLLELLDECYPGLPKEIPVEIGTKRYMFPIFIYVLRHTFWRPREIIFHFVGLISSFEFYRGHSPITTADVKAIVKEQAKALVASEFIDEFKSTIQNIEHIIERFRSGPQYYAYAEFMTRLESIEFDFYLNPHAIEQSSVHHKLRLLYEIGFIGIRLTNIQVSNHSRPRNVFSFSEGMVIFDEISKEGFDGAKICIHPAFIEYLNMQIDPNQEITLDINWEYLRQNEIRRNAALRW